MGDEEKSLDEILGASLSDAYDAAEAAPEAAEGGQGDAAPADSAPASGQENRDPVTGRFTAKSGQAADDAPAEQNTDQGSAPGDGAASTETPSDAPASWSDAEKAIWKTLPPDVQAIFARREADFSKGLEQKTRGYEALEQVLAPRRVGLAAEYGSVENAIGTLFKLSDFAAQDKPGFVKWFCQAHNLDPKTIFGAAEAPQPGQEPSADGGASTPPEMAAVLAEVNALKRQMTEAINRPVIERAETDLKRFEGEAQTKYPHYANPVVKKGMAGLLASSDADLTYEQAYERVVWSIPEIRQQLLDAERKAAVDAKAKEAAEAAKKARTAAGPQLRSVGASNDVKPGPRSIDQTMSEVYDRSMGAA